MNDIPDFYSLTSYNMTDNQNYDKESVSCQKNSYNQYREKISRQNLQSQHTSYSLANSYNTDTWKSNNFLRELTFSDKKSLAEVSHQELTDKKIITNLVAPSMYSVSKEFKILYKKICKYFDNFWHTFNKDIAVLAKDLLVKNCDPTDENIEQFIFGKVWCQKLSKYLDASDFSAFKKSSSSLKSLKNCVAKSLKIHVEYLVAVHNQENLSYSEDVLAKIKKLDQLTIHLTNPLAS
ncbi:hypothetical protein F8M41_017873 [Gigaspora margarita]|uniref:Uncharacterized protein n=1 Tax=Gigaspora margarita TaxID=4874 RepID=A0A8H4AMD0_GIGMA|nr:hypothetical protein F8M41_017873 [Gigaspora margarita]